MCELNSFKENTQLAAARAVIAQTGKSPRQLGNESRQKLLAWVYRWGFTCSSVCQLLLNRTSGGYLQKLTQQNLLVATKTKSGTPINYYTLSELGLQEIERLSDALLRYSELDPFKVNQLQIRHYLIAQKITIKALDSGQIIDFETERMRLIDGDRQGEKRPDVVWITSGMERYAIEIELSAKWDRNLDSFILGIARDLQSSKNKDDGISRYVIISDSRAIIDRYQQAKIGRAHV